MNNFVYENRQFVYIEPSTRKVLLDCNRFMENKSRVPLHSVADKHTIPDIILGLMEEYQETVNTTEEAILGFYYTMIDVLMVSEHIKSSSPKKVLELGCQNGVLSYHLATLLGKLHPNSLLYSVTNTIGNESENLWLNYISQVEELPKLGFAAADYEETHLKDEYFDVVILNGSVPMEQPRQVVEEAIRMTKPGGKIICLAWKQPLLEASFQMLLPEGQKYTIDYESSVWIDCLQKSGQMPK